MATSTWQKSPARRRVRGWLSMMAAGVLASVALTATAPAPAPAAVPTYGLGSCAWMGVVVDQGHEGDCARALQRFLRYTVNYRGYGPICEEIEFGRGEMIRITGTMNRQTRKFLECYQIYVNFRVGQPDRHDIHGYDTRLAVDGVAHRRDFVVMVHDTCAKDDRYLDEEGQGRFGGLWFCVK